MLTLYYHPLASFCHKVQLALYENETDFEARIVDLGSASSSAEMLSFWPMGKIPVLRDQRRQQTIPETSIIIEYLDRHYPGRAALVPKDPEQAREVRLWDRFFDLYVNVPMGKLVVDRLRPAGQSDTWGVQEAQKTLERAYEILERQLADHSWAAGDSFSMADCAAAPALFYADIVAPFSARYANVAAYFNRLVARPSFIRTLNEARLYFELFPLRADIPARFLSVSP